MKVFVALAAFAHNNKFGSYILVEKTSKLSLPKKELINYHSQTIVNSMINHILGIDWYIPIRQDGFYEEDSQTAYVLYSIYLEDTIILKNDKYSWIKLDNLNKLDEFDKAIIRTSALKRF